MKVILLKDVKKVGKKDQTVDVSDGYAVNYLFPHKLAVQVSKKSLEVLDVQKQTEKDNQERLKKEAENIAKQLDSVVITIPMKTGKDGKLFGNVSFKKIEEELLIQHNIQIDKRKFVDKISMDFLGTYKLKNELYKGIFGVVTVHIIEDK